MAASIKSNTFSLGSASSLGRDSCKIYLTPLVFFDKGESRLLIFILMKSPASCALCGSTEHITVAQNIHDYEYGAPGVYSWEKCESCGLIRLNPFPDGETLALAYPYNYHAYVEPKSKITKYLIGKTRHKVAKALSHKISINGSILDIGCSTGELLSTIQTFGRFQLFGVEYNEKAASIARQKGIDVWQGEFEKIKIQNNSMDLVLMQHVLEHVYDPISTMQKTFDILKPKGSVLGELPNFDSWDAKIFGRYWGGAILPDTFFISRHILYVWFWRGADLLIFEFLQLFTLGTGRYPFKTGCAGTEKT